LTGYIIYWDQGTDNYVPLAAFDQTVTQYAKTFGLTTGNLYKFAVSARNAIGESDRSTSLEVIAARTPDAPENLSLVSASPESISFTWSVPYDGGSPILFYKIFWD